MSMTMEQVLAINNLATAQVRKDTPSLMDVKGLGCLSGRISNSGQEDGDILRWCDQGV